MELLINILSVLFFGGALLLLPKYWRHEIKTLDKKPSWWLWGEQSWLGWMRWSTTAVITIFTVVLVYFVIETVSLSESSLGYKIMVILTGVIFISGVLLGITIFLFNRPKKIVSPHMREQPGALAVWLNKQK